MTDTTTSTEDNSFETSTTALEVNGVTLGALDTVRTADYSTYSLSVRGRTLGSVTLYDDFKHPADLAFGSEPIAWVGTTDGDERGVDVDIAFSASLSESEGSLE